MEEDHPDTTTSLNSLANLLGYQDSFEEARPLYERALAIYKKAFGEEHQLTQMVRENLRILDSLQG